ncbi:MAG: TetR/AcrR family transcriptional regulator [Sphingomonas sp.]|jgi:AcrR family transcriptional regulator|uniref:TetR/AcrR family transcriptional regulator n=1 Tax=Sphingomonas sp. TaxID=28214 RepID=UPI0035674926
MARPREFDRDVALEEAIKVFADHGYEGTSTDVLLKRMGISRQSLYDTFGDKRRLYLEALRRYNGTSAAEIIAALHAHASPARGLEAALLDFAARPAGDGCLGVCSIVEFGSAAPDIAAINAASGGVLAAAFEAVIVKGKAQGDFAADLDPKAATQFLATTLSGMKVAARGGTSPESLRSVARMALRSLT